MNNFIVRRGRAEDAKDFSRLILYSTHGYLLRLFGFRARSVTAGLFSHRRNAFSFENSYFIEVDGRVAGMALAYDYSVKRETIRNNLLILKYLKLGVFRRLGRLVKAARATGRISLDEHYLSGIAIYPKYRGLGFGRALIGAVENSVKAAGSRRIVLRAEANNEIAIKWYENHGYRKEHKTAPLRIKGRNFRFFRMAKDIK